MAENRPHYRHELKFLINAGDRELLARRLDVLMRRDPHAPEGGYKIRSLYFDDYWHTAYGEKLMGVTGGKSTGSVFMTTMTPLSSWNARASRTATFISAPSPCLGRKSIGSCGETTRFFWGGKSRCAASSMSS